MLRTLLGILSAAVAAYLFITAFACFEVGRDIAQAQSNPFVSVGASLAGRDTVERVAIAQHNVPSAFTASPTFWMAMRLTE